MTTTRKVKRTGFVSRKWPVPTWAVEAANARLDMLMREFPHGNVRAELRVGAYIGNDVVPYVMNTYIGDHFVLDNFYPPRDA